MQLHISLLRPLTEEVDAGLAKSIADLELSTDVAWAVTTAGAKVGRRDGDHSLTHSLTLR